MDPKKLAGYAKRKGAPVKGAAAKKFGAGGKKGAASAHEDDEKMEDDGDEDEDEEDEDENGDESDADDVDAADGDDTDADADDGDDGDDGDDDHLEPDEDDFEASEGDDEEDAALAAKVAAQMAAGKVDKGVVKIVDGYDPDVDGNPPSWAPDEETWERAKKAVGSEEESDYDDYWAIVTTVYKQMKGAIKGG